MCLIISLPISTAAQVNKDTVTAYGWNSCGGWYKTGGTFLNYCPLCKSHGTLSYNPKHVYEGEWTCRHCDADYCNCGRCKAGHSGVYLIKVVVEKKQPTPVSDTLNTQKQDGNKLNILTQRINKPFGGIYGNIEG